MSPPAVAKNIVAAVFEGTAGLVKPDKPVATKPTRSFAQTATFVDARQMPKADNQAVGGPRTGSLPSEDEPTPVEGALPKPGKSRDRKMQSIDVLMLAAGWHTSTGPTPSRLSTGQVESPTGLKATSGGGAAPQQKQSVSATSGRPSAGIAGSTQGDVGGTLKKSITPPAGRKGHVVELKEGDAKTLVQSSAQSNAQQVMKTLDGLVPGIDRCRQPNQGRRDAEKSTPLTLTPRGLQQSSRDVRSQGRASPATFGDSPQPRHATGETSMPASGKEATLSQLGDNPVMQLQPAVLGTDTSAVISHGVSDRTSTAGSFDDGRIADGVAQSIREQIHDSVRASLARGDQQVVIRLHPPELGSVVVRFEQQNEQIDGVLEVSRNDTRNEVEQALPQVLQSLQELGIQVRKLEVTVSDQPQGDPLRQQLQQDAWAQQQDSDRSPSQAYRSNPESRIPNLESSASVDVPAGRIDMLA